MGPLVLFLVLGCYFWFVRTNKFAAMFAQAAGYDPQKYSVFIEVTMWWFAGASLFLVAGDFTPYLP